MRERENQSEIEKEMDIPDSAVRVLPTPGGPERRRIMPFPVWNKDQQYSSSHSFFIH